MNLYSTVGDCKIRRAHTSTSLSVTGEDKCRVYNLQLKMKLLSKKVAIVTGGSRGIGKAIVERLAAHGASVVFTYHSSAAKANELVANLSEQYPEQSFKAYQSDASVFEQWDDVLSNNLKSVFNLSKHVAKPMLKQRSGSIINITSIIGLKGNAGQANYAASKAGIVGFTKSVAQELGSRNIRCNAIAPGYIGNRHDRQPRRRHQRIVCRKYPYETIW